MLLTLEEMNFLSKTTKKGDGGLLIAKTGLSKKEKEKLLDIDERNLITYGEHWIKIEE